MTLEIKNSPTRAALPSSNRPTVRRSKSLPVTLSADKIETRLSSTSGSSSAAAELPHPSVNLASKKATPKPPPRPPQVNQEALLAFGHTGSYRLGDQEFNPTMLYKGGINAGREVQIGSKKALEQVLNNGKFVLMSPERPAKELSSPEFIEGLRSLKMATPAEGRDALHASFVDLLRREGFPYAKQYHASSADPNDPTAALHGAFHGLLAGEGFPYAEQRGVWDGQEEISYMIFMDHPESAKDPLFQGRFLPRLREIAKALQQDAMIVAEHHNFLLLNVRENSECHYGRSIRSKVVPAEVVYEAIFSGWSAEFV